MYKLYATQQHTVNLHLVCLSLKDAMVQSLSVDQRFQLLTYQYRAGDHEFTKGNLSLVSTPFSRFTTVGMCTLTSERTILYLVHRKLRHGYILTSLTRTLCVHLISLAPYDGGTRVLGVSGHGQQFMTGGVLVPLWIAAVLGY